MSESEENGGRRGHRIFRFVKVFSFARGRRHKGEQPVRLHQRQFVVGPRPFEDLEGWTVSRLQPDLYLSRCPTLPVRSVDDGMLLGLAVSSDDSRLPEGWAGRYVLLRDGTLEMDTSGLLGVFYRQVEDERWISSSPELLRGIPPELDEPTRRLQWAVEGNEWFEPPHSGVAPVRRLLPSQRLPLTGGTLEPKPLLPAPESVDPIADAEHRLRRVVGELAELGPLWVSLTGGRDSRLVLAACVAEGLEPVTFTFDRGPGAEYPLSAGDRQLPPRLADLAGLEHRLLRPRAYDHEAAALFDRHCCFHCVGGERYEAAHGQWDQVPREAIVLGGNVFEAGRAYYRVYQPPAPREWDTWARNTPHDLDHGDRLYIEQRLAGWLASAEQAADVNGRARVYPANCGRLLAAFLTLPDDVRARGLHQTRLIERMAPPLSRLPFNPVPMRQRVRARWHRERALVRHHEGVARYVRARVDVLSRRFNESISTVMLGGAGVLLSLPNAV
jgi:hypothetical protein